MKMRAKCAKRLEAEVFGGWSFLENFPEIMTEGVDVLQHNGVWYIHKDGKPVDGVRSFSISSAFFTEKELDVFEIIE